ncbi:MAG TPA: OmpH family outer membrane protein [Vicinamibacterales bacterium]|nr:OmpH family outer membrane protein [Vicinamibacterales bacterium]
MRVLKSSMIVAALTLALSAPVFAQTTPPAGGAKPQTPAQPPATAPAQPALKPATPPAPFPQDAKFAFIDINAIAANSVSGKEASKKLAGLNDKKLAEINDKNKQLQALQTKLSTGGPVLSESARAQLEKEIDKMQRDIQFTQQNAQAEMQELQNDLQGEFQKKLLPIIEEVAKEKGLHAVFSIADSGAAYVHAGLNISDEVVKRLDAKK